MASSILATDVVIKINDKIFGCAQSASFSTKREMVDVACAATNGFKTQKPGAESWDGSVSAIVRTFPTAEVASNVTLREMYTYLKEGTSIDIEYEIGGVDGFVFTSSAFLSNVDISIPDGSGAVTWTANLVGAEPLVMAA